MSTFEQIKKSMEASHNGIEMIKNLLISGEHVQRLRRSQWRIFNIELIESVGDDYKVIMKDENTDDCIETIVRKDALFALIAVTENEEPELVIYPDILRHRTGLLPIQ